MSKQDEFIDDVIEALSRNIDENGPLPYIFAEELICIMEEYGIVIEGE
jgi:hypothetical protein